MWCIVSTWLACASPPPAAPAEPAATEAPASSAPATANALQEPSESRYAATHVLIGWKGASQSTSTRTEAQAEALAREVHAKALAGEDLAALAKAHSDGPSAPRGGMLGVYATGTMVPSFERAIASVDVGEIAPLVRSPYGWHIARRDAVYDAHAAQVLVSWRGAWRSKATRSKPEALARIEQARDALSAGKPFADVAASFSDGPESRAGGDLGRVAPGQFLPAFEVALFALAPGAISEVVETDYGFHLIQRLD